MTTQPQDATAGHAAGAAIEDHAAIGDGRTVALIDRSGTVDWLPLPSLDSPPVFAALLDPERGGRLVLRPVSEFTSRRRYLPGTNVLETTFTTASGTVRVTDALITGVAGRLPWVEFARRVDGVDGIVVMDWAVEPGTVLGGASPWAEHIDGSRILRVGTVNIGVTGLTDGEDDPEAPRFGGRIRVGEGTRRTLTMVATDDEPLHLPVPGNVDIGIDRTTSNWELWSNTFSYSGPWADAVQRSALALKLLLYAPTGAIAAAATTSLPETPRGGKNWDYRFAWVRDTAYALRALERFGLREETHAAISWLLRAVKGDPAELRVLYGLREESSADPVEHDVPGWRGIGPVVTGNRAAEQLQLGVYGDLLSVALAYAAAGNVLDVPTRRLVSDVADRVCDVWREPDSGMWELTELRHHTSSKMGCWQALQAALQLAELGQAAGNPARWRREADLIHDWVDEHCWSDRLGAYTMVAGEDELDASVLLHAPSGFDRGERMRSTIAALRRELGSGPLLFRFTGARAEGEAPFVACSFWLAAALACVGDVADATSVMDDLVGRANDVGLYAEMIDEDGTFWGNFPQALSHLGLIDAALTIADLRR
ncbi:glycoside hydrolase family 15 protein [Leifsonia shinshuensis]|uniref:glycoside hydrolase family 15 protein n=1 Tax=Leifsonia shinshuensis TaxID=150026 RepID=UPI00285D38E9|nr:glycoside hydrolase family 15 protein [Leifsonia shinshuensis]MDR6972544.1 GH15 family glucan-1,4-alpha-glucosidase [Leifsonia shinshuensis]